MIEVVAAVIQRNDLFLLCQRPAHKHHGGKWEFPGGKLEAGESLAQALTRELEEELALRCVSVGPTIASHVDVGQRCRIHFVRAEVRGEVELREHSASAWVTISQALCLPLAPTDAVFLSHFQS